MFMKTKSLMIIFVFLLLALMSGWVVFSTREKGQPVLSQTGKIVDLSSQSVAKEKLIVQPEKTAPSTTGEVPAGQIQVTMLINGAEYRTIMKPDSSVYDLMSALKEQKKIDFKGKDYANLGFFIEEINGVRNNSAGLPAQAGKNWLYYVNGQPAQVGVSYYKLNNNDTIEWKYEKKSF